MATTWSVAIRNADLNTRGALLNHGTLCLYDGTRPASVDTAITTQNLVVTLTFGSPAFGAAAAGSISANALTGGRGAHQPSATVAWGRCFASDGTTAVCDGSVGAEITIDNALIPYNVMVTCSGVTFGEPT